MTDSLMNTYRRLPVCFEKGDGAWLWDTNGKRYLDALGGIAVCALGHAHAAVARAVCEQMQNLVHTSNIYRIAKQEQLASMLTDVTRMDNLFFSNSGAEANEAAIKIARLFGHRQGVKSPTVVVTENSFHGRTLATLTATGNRKVQAGFEPLVQGFLRVPFNDVAALQNVAKNSPDVVAVLIEPIQGEGGIRVPSPDYLNQVRRLCDDNHWLMILDEIQTGLCRTGKWLAVDHSSIQADIVTLAKALGNGVPIGACVARGQATEVLQPGNHGSTFGGNPLACAAALAVIETMKSERLDERAAHLGDHLLGGLRSALQDNPLVSDVRGQGLMIGVELTKPCAELVTIALEKGLLINVTAEKVIRLLPPLIADEEQIDLIVEGIATSIADFSQQ